MQSCDRIIHARWVIPVAPGSGVLEDHSVVIDGTRIVAIVPQSEARSRYRTDEETDCTRHAVIPGLINLHSHAAMTLFRGIADDLPLQTWLERYIWPQEARWVGRSFVRDGSDLAIAEMLLGGTTCFNDMYFFPEETAAAANDAGIRAVLGMIVIGFESAWAENVDAYFANGQRMHDEYRAHPLIQTTFAPHAPYTVDDDALARVAKLVEELDIPIHMHLHETSSEVEQALKDTGERPLARLKRLGLLSNRLIAVHMTSLDEQDIECIANYGVTVAHCPESNMKLASGACPVSRLLKAGINVGIGTDGAASNNDLDMLSEMRSAALLAKLTASDPCAVPAAEALRMATYNAAKALQLDDRIGSLEVGKEADIAAIDLGDIRAKPVFDPVSQIVYASHRDQVSDVWVAGRHLVKNRQLQSLDMPTLHANADLWQARIAGKNGDR